MKKYLLIIISLFVIVISGCKKEEYEPTGKIYIKTSPAWGDAGADLVIDMEIEKEEYENKQGTKISLKIGFGHLFESDFSAKNTLFINVYENPWKDKNSLYSKELIIDNFYSDLYLTTKPKNKSFLFIPFYGHFYPIYHENMEIEIPLNISSGYIRATLEERNNEDESIIYQFHLDLKFIQENGVIKFIIDGDRLAQ